MPNNQCGCGGTFHFDRNFGVWVCGRCFMDWKQEGDMAAGPITKVFRRFRERRAFFDALAHSEYKYRSVNGIVTDTGMSEKRVKELLADYMQKGLVQKQPNGEWYGLKSRVQAEEAKSAAAARGGMYDCYP